MTRALLWSPCSISIVLTLCLGTDRLSAAIGFGIESDQMVLRIDAEAPVIREIPDSFLGLSFSYDQLEQEIGADAGDANTLLRDFLHRLEAIHGLPVLRFGGKSTLETGYAADGGIASNGLPHALTPDKLAAINALLGQSGSQAVFGLNTRFVDSETVFEDMAAGIATHIDADHLQAFELGSEPNFSEANGFRSAGYDFAAFQAETISFLDRYAATGLTVPMIGPSLNLLDRTPAEDPLWNGQAASYLSSHGDRLGAFSQLLYPFSSNAPVGDPSYLSGGTIVDYNISSEQANALGPLIDQAHAAGKPFWIQELGISSDGDGGMPGFGNSEGHAMWAVHNAFSFLERGGGPDQSIRVQRQPLFAWLLERFYNRRVASGGPKHLLRNGDCCTCVRQKPETHRYRTVD